MRTIPEDQFMDLFEKAIYMESVMKTLGATTPKEALEKAMCYSNCPHETWQGGCKDPRKQGCTDSHCFEAIDPEGENNDEIRGQHEVPQAADVQRDC